MLLETSKIAGCARIVLPSFRLFPMPEPKGGRGPYTRKELKRLLKTGFISAEMRRDIIAAFKICKAAILEVSKKHPPN